jgi:hypothetical protein
MTMGMLGIPRNRPDEYTYTATGEIDNDPYSPVCVDIPTNPEFSGVEGISDTIATAKSFVSNNFLLVAALAFGAYLIWSKQKG